MADNAASTNRYPGECQIPGCTREDGVCIGYHCPGCGKPTTSMGHPDCAPPAEPTSRAMRSLQDAVTELRRRINNALALTEPHPLRHWDTQWPIRAALEGMTAAEYAGKDGTDFVAPAEPTGEADRG